MRIDQQLNVAPLGINARQHFFLSAWFNLVHHNSLDAYRVRVMNPLNILRELRRMFDPPANDADRKAVALEALEILNDHPVITSNASKHKGLPDALAFIKEAVDKEGGFKKNSVLLRSFMREVETALNSHFLADCFDWMEATLRSAPAAESEEQRVKSYAEIERVCRDMVSVAHDFGFSLESLFHLYRLFLPKDPVVAGGQRAQAPRPDGAEPAETGDLAMATAFQAPIEGEEFAKSALQMPEPYDFSKRFERLRSEILADSKEHQVTFVVTGAPRVSEVCCGDFGSVVISQNEPQQLGVAFQKFFAPGPRRLFASAVVKSRDGRSAGLQAYGEIGQILDLMRFEYDTPLIKAGTRFLLKDGERFRLLSLPQLVPNPEAEPPTKTLEEFVAHLSDLAARDTSQTETRDRIFSAFRLYRQGTGANMFDNKLVNWWTGLEYLTSGGKAGGDIGEAVKSALAPTLALTYLPKHLVAFRSALGSLNVEVQVADTSVKIKHCSNSEFYALLKDPTQSAAILDACTSQPYLWKHLLAFIKEIGTPASTAALIASHDRRIRWQIERIYRTRCDIVHAGRQVITASLLCSNLEFYLRMTLKSMLKGFSNVATLMGPAEFFERQRYQFSQVMQELATDRNRPGTDALLIASLD